MFVVAYIIKEKDKNHENIIRLRDIFLGQKAYIDNYYNTRRYELTKKIIPNLEEREKQIVIKENAIDENKKYIAEQMQKLEGMGKKAKNIFTRKEICSYY